MMLPPTIRTGEELLKYKEAKIPLASAYFSFGTSDCNTDNDIINIERPIPCMILQAMRNEAFMLKPAVDMLIINMDIMMSKITFYRMCLITFRQWGPLQQQL